MMLATLILTLLVAETDFEEYYEHEQVVEEEVVFVPVFQEELIAQQESRRELIAYVQAFDERDYEVVETSAGVFYTESTLPPFELKKVMSRYVSPGDTVVDFGAQYGQGAVLLAHLVGPTGKVIAFESSPEKFRMLFWNLANNGVQNALLHCRVLEEGDKTLDSLELESVSFMKFNALGREDLVFRGAMETIRKHRPVLMVNMLGGIPIEQTDRFVRDIFNKRIDDIEALGYTTERISSSYYLALPN